MKISGYTCIRNGIELDYPFDLAIKSLLPVCDEVVACDSDSTDGTSQELARIAAENPKVRIINYPWPNPKNNPRWWVEFVNFCREHLQFPMQLQLDADEVLDDSPACHQTILDTAQDARISDKLACRRFNRLNFWRDPHSLIPEGQCCGKYVIRMGPSKYWMPSDEPHHAGELPIVDEAKYHQDLRIFHLGFLRRPEAFFKKAKVVQDAFFGGYDDRLVKAEEKGTPWWEEGCQYLDRLERYDGTYPAGVREWLIERGHEI